MTYFEISKEVQIETGHRVVGHEGKCANLHGHSYRFTVLLRSQDLRAPGFVVDFGYISEKIKEWDHKMLLWDEDIFLSPSLLGGQLEAGVLSVPFNPTAESMAKYLCEEFADSFTDLEYVEVTVYETDTSSATFFLDLGEA